MLPEFRSWSERLLAAGGEKPKRIRYTRKSTESEERQTASHDQQSSKADERWGVIEPIWWWRDSCSGTNFDRPGYLDILAFCRANRRPTSDPGRVEMYDPSRFGRILDAYGNPDLATFQRAYDEFEQLGWGVHFVTLVRSGSQLPDTLMIIMHAYNSAEYSARLSENSRRGRQSHSRNGWWTAGRAPWGTKRKDVRADRILKEGESSTPGGGGTILVPDSDVLEMWCAVAKRLLGGSSLDAIGAELYSSGVRGPRSGNLGHKSIRNFLTNPVLIGEVEFLAEEKDGTRERARMTAKWPPMVDRDLFDAVTQELERRARPIGGRKRKQRGLYPLTPVCAHCGAEYHGGRLADGQGATRSYTHARPTERFDEQQYGLFKAAGCKVWYVDACELEDKIKDLIVRERASQAFEEEVRDLILNRDEFRKSADSLVAEERRKVKRAEIKYDQWLRIIGSAEVLYDADVPQDDDPLVAELATLRNNIAAAKRSLANAERFAKSNESAWKKLSSMINETRNIATAWDNSGPTERKTLLDYWVYDVMIAVEPVDGKKRANWKTAIVTLRTAPNAPKYFDVSGQIARIDNADRNAWSTDASDSVASDAISALIASGSPILPSAQAACSRTSGSSSDNAAVSAGMASADPVLPSATATLRKNPRRFDRLTGDFLEKSRQSSGDIDISSASTGEVLSGCGASAGSDSARENLWLYGQTS